MQRLVQILLGALLVVAAGGCKAPGVGDPCDPEQVPEGGFVRSEAYLETSSVQCRTRVCMVYKLSGVPAFRDPETGVLSCEGDPNCGDPDDTERRVYCTCRCDAPAGSNTSLCDCPDNYTCTQVLELGGEGIRGSYCVRNDTLVEGMGG